MGDPTSAIGKPTMAPPILPANAPTSESQMDLRLRALSGPGGAGKELDDFAHNGKRQ